MVFVIFIGLIGYWSLFPTKDVEGAFAAKETLELFATTSQGWLTIPVNIVEYIGENVVSENK